jgi:predicted CxxxxCH...CXXCH cytochrome family protein
MRRSLTRANGTGVAGSMLATLLSVGLSACTKVRPIDGDGDGDGGSGRRDGRSLIHRGGILDPASADFHGRLLRDQKYAFGVCQGCHGDDFAGGRSGVSCVSCHAQGPTACTTCHGAIQKNGSHGRHLGQGPLAKTFRCDECHRVPAVYTDVGHILLADGSLDPPPAEVILGATAALTPPGSTRAGAPAWDPAAQSCSNVYCHGAVLGDDAAGNIRPIWSAAGTGQADCGSCHGLPPNHGGANLTDGRCAACHSSVVAADRTIIAPDKHIDGQIQLGDPAAGCAGCHGSAASAAPPRDLAGQTAPSAPGVGAHQAHLTASARLRGPIACGECHRVPSDVTSAGHFVGHAAGAGDDPVPGAEVFPADAQGQAAVGVLASTGGAAPRWDRAAGTCSSVYCHGGGTTLGADTTAGVDRAPRWTAGGGLTCGAACHGLPPAFAPHLATMTRTDCASCHPRTVDPSGVVIISGANGAETSAHMNGVLDVAP